MALFSKIVAFLRRVLGLERILCDSCKYDWGDACTNPGRPNATKCSEYDARRG